MELEWDTRPLSIVHQSREWHDGHAGAGSSSAAATAFMSRRRSSAVRVPPPGPPPNQPIPSLPSHPNGSHFGTFDVMPDPPALMFDSAVYDPSYLSGTSNHAHPYSRPVASANLTAVAAFSQRQLVSPTSSSPPLVEVSPVDNLSDPPPRSMLRSRPSPIPTHEIVPDRLLLSPSEPRSTGEPRPSSRRALTKALELAREAVQLDSTNDDPYGAVLAYGKSVALLSEVMERVMRGEDSTESQKKKNGRRRSVVAQEEEVRRLKSIHDTYADRMNILSMIYNIPLPSNSPPSTYASSSISASSNSTQPSSPTSSERSGPSSQTSLSSYNQESRGRRRGSSDTRRASESADEDDTAVIDMALYTLDNTSSNVTTGRSSPALSPAHPYALAPTITVVSSSSTSRRDSVVVGHPSNVGLISKRPRASSKLPPPAPPPTTSPPPAPTTPTIIEPQPEQSTLNPNRYDGGRSRGNSVSHSRTGSGSRLAALQEEVERPDVQTSPFLSESIPLDSDQARQQLRSVFVSHTNRDSHPLPPLPSPASVETATTPRHHAVVVDDPELPTPISPNQYTPRPRGGSTLSIRSEMTPTNKKALINGSTVNGTISIRRSKVSAPPLTSDGSPPLDSASVPFMQSTRLNASSLPASTISSLGMRTRASSQPGRRPSAASANAGSYPFPPFSAASMQNGGPVPRKVSIPSRLNPDAPQIKINPALLSPPIFEQSTQPLVPPPPIPHENIPATPDSPLPPIAPPDPLRKPYHMMSLLRQTMTSKSGGYITRRLHVPQGVWSQGGAKLTNIPEKIRVVEVLCSALEEIQNWSAENFGAGNVSSGISMGIGSIGRQEGEQWAAKLEDFSTVCDGVVGNFGKKLGVGEGFVTKKSNAMTSWGGKLTRQFDKLTNGKNLDSPATYVQGLCKLFLQAQILDEHTKAVSSQPIAPIYASFPPEMRAAMELKLRHASEFFAKVVLTFVIRDMALLLDKYVKKCEKWLAE